ncbi:hypothetical protein ABIA38_008198 [Embleya sp. AB8]
MRNPRRADALRRRVARVAGERRVEARLFDPETERPRGPVDYSSASPPSGDRARPPPGQRIFSTSFPVFSPLKSRSSVAGKSVTSPSTTSSREINRPSASQPASSARASG